MSTVVLSMVWFRRLFFHLSSVLQSVFTFGLLNDLSFHYSDSTFFRNTFHIMFLNLSHSICLLQTSYSLCAHAPFYLFWSVKAAFKECLSTGTVFPLLQDSFFFLTITC
jgi:hypothetical protein